MIERPAVQQSRFDSSHLRLSKFEIQAKGLQPKPLDLKVKTESLSNLNDSMESLCKVRKVRLAFRNRKSDVLIQNF